MKLILVISFALLSSFGFSQKIKFKISNFDKDTTVHLIRYFGKGLYYADTAEIKAGVVEFDGSKQKPGVFALFFPDQKMLEFVYNKEAEINIEANFPNLLATAKVKKSDENKIFLAYLNMMMTERQKANMLIEKRKSHAADSEGYKNLTAEVNEITNKVEAKQKEIVKNDWDKLVARIVYMSMDIDIPEAPKDENGVILDSAFRFKYYRSHYWDHIDLKDSRLVRTKLFHNKLEGYFSKNMMIQHWDTVIYYAYDLIDRMDPKSDMYQYCVSWITSHYEKSQIMGMDKVFVRMAEKYYCALDDDGNQKAFWMLEKPSFKEKLDKLCEKAETLKNLVVGVRPPNVILRDTSDTKWYGFYDLKSDYTILYFWDPECGHCKKITPKLQKLYAQKFKDRNVEIFAVGKAVGEDFDKWKSFVKKNNLEFINVAVTDKLYKAALEDPRQFVPKYTTIESLNYQKTYDIFSTPRVFILDKDKKIIAKSLSVAQLESFIDRMQGMSDLPKIYKEEEENKEDSQMH